MIDSIDSASGGEIEMIRPEDIAAMHARRLRDVDIIHRTTSLVVAEEWRMAAAAMLFTGLVTTFFLFWVAMRDGIDTAWAVPALIGVWAAVGLGAYAHRRHLGKWAGVMRAMAEAREDSEMERHLSSLKGDAR